MSNTRLPKPPTDARFWDQLSPAARRVLQRQGIAAGELLGAPAPASSSSAAIATPPSSSSSRSSSSPPGFATPAAVNRRERRAVVQLERPTATPRRARRDEYNRQLERDEKRLAKLRAVIVARNGDLEGHRPFSIRPIPLRVLIMCRTIMGDLSGFAVRAAFRRCRNKVAVGAIKRAALVPDDHGTARYTWEDRRARSIAALGLALLELSVPSVRRGAWASIVRGISRGALCALLASPFEPDKRPALTTLVGQHRAGGTLENGQVGYLRALIEAGFCYSQQLPAHQVEAFELGPSGYASNRYWLVNSTPTAPLSDDHKRSLLELHQHGLDAHRERLLRARRAPAPADHGDVAARAAAALGAPAAPAQAPPARPPD